MVFGFPTKMDAVVVLQLLQCTFILLKKLLKSGHPIPSGEHCEDDNRTRDECSHRPQVEIREKEGGTAKVITLKLT
jgi:hypothetical protein